MDSLQRNTDEKQIILLSITVGSLLAFSLIGSGLTFSFWTVSISLGLIGAGGSTVGVFGGNRFFRSLSGDNATPFHFFKPLSEITMSFF